MDISPYANKTLPRFERTTAGVEPYTGTWGNDQAMHLLRRTTFGPALANAALLSTMSVNAAVDMLVAAPPDEPSLPLNVDTRDIVPVGDSWVYAIYQDPAVDSFNPTGVRLNSLKSWWMDLIVQQNLSLREKMVLFWHNHFVTETDVVNDPRFSYRYLALLRSHALGNWKDLARMISFDGAMSGTSMAIPTPNRARMKTMAVNFRNCSPSGRVRKSLPGTIPTTPKPTSKLRRGC